MEKLLTIGGMMLGGWLAWAVGERLGLMGAVVLGVVGTGLGLYLGRRVVRDHF